MGSPPARRRVLFVEDEPALRLSYERAFQARYQAVCAATGREALERFADAAPDVVVLDLRLPDTDGIALLRQFRQARPDLPVVITSAYVSLEPQLQVLDLPHHGYLVKPFDLIDLARHIDAAR